ncbi:MAG: dihydrolipoyl dehydrogenase [bacterium]
MDEMLKRDLVIIGAGPGGYVAALYAAKRGMKVTLVEKRFIGGTCLNVGCIPTKTLIKAAEVYREAKNARFFGIVTDNVAVDFKRVQERKNQVVKTLVDGTVFLIEKAGIERIEGMARFLSPTVLEIESAAGKVVVQAEHVIIATGAKTKMLPIPGVDLPCVLDSEGLLALAELPRSLAVIGGGIIGMEFAFAFAHLGVKVDVIEALPDILTTADREAVQKLSRFAKQQKINIQTGATVIRIDSLMEEGAEIVYRQNGTDHSVRADRVLVAVGRVPEIVGLGIENAGVLIGMNRGIAVDERMRTNVPSIHAIGDVTNRIQLAHAASRQAIVAVDDILGKDTRMDYDFIPSVLYTSPALAWVGKTEAELLATGVPIRITKSPFGANGRAIIANQPLGFVKLIQNQETKRLIGATVFGDGADEMIATLTVAMQNGLSAAAVAATIFAHPTQSETIREAAAGILGEAIHYNE